MFACEEHPEVLKVSKRLTNLEFLCDSHPLMHLTHVIRSRVHCVCDDVVLQRLRSGGAARAAQNRSFNPSRTNLFYE
eukprot:2099359-Amphidinium_carterae.1